MSFEHELVRNRFALLERKNATGQRHILAKLRHRTYDIARTRPKQRQALVNSAVAIEELLRRPKGRVVQLLGTLDQAKAFTKLAVQ